MTLMTRLLFAVGLGLSSLTNHALGTPTYRPADSYDQKPLVDSSHEPTYPGEPVYPYTLKEHAADAEICKAGSGQFTGTVSVSDQKKLFFWFFESRNDPQNSPITIWLNGGPGGSSLMGLFLEIGPCSVHVSNNGDAHVNSTVFEKHSWTEFTNLLIIDQPAGVGFSTVNGTNLGGPDNIPEAAEDFYRFLVAFFNDIFPQYASHDLHIAGESFGGRYVPGFVNYIYTRGLHYRHHPNLLPKIKSIILVDAVIDMTSSFELSLYDHFCNPSDPPKKFMPFNSTTCDALELAAPECEHLVALCRETYNPRICQTSFLVCFDNLAKYVMDEVYTGGRDPYDDRRPCGDNPPICQPLDETGSYSQFVNQSWAKKELGFPEGYDFRALNWDLNRRWEESLEMFIPNTREMVYILDNTEIRVLVLNGNNDVIVNTEGQKRVYDTLVWRRQSSFRMGEFGDWEWPSSPKSESQAESRGREARVMTKGGQWKKADDGEVKDRLAFFTIDEAGHPSPGDQREAITWLVGCWTGTRKSDGKCPV